MDVLLNSGGGEFAAAEPENLTFPNPGPLVIGDFDGDGEPDIVTMNAAGLLDYLQGNGDGSFAAAVQSQPTLGTPTGMASADLNGDAKSDLIFSETNAARGRRRRHWRGSGHDAARSFTCHRRRVARLRHFWTEAQVFPACHTPQHKFEYNRSWPP